MLASRLAWRDLRRSFGEFRLLVLCAAFGAAAIASVGLLSAAILDGVRSGARLSIGGDVSLRSFHQPPRPEHLAAFAAAGSTSLTAELRPLARRGGKGVLVELKAVEDSYPLYGALALDPPLPVTEALGLRDGVWGAVVAPSLLPALQASLGDIVEVGNRRFAIRALIADEPDRAMRAFVLGPRMIVALPALADSALLAPGSLTYWYARIRMEPGLDPASWIAGFERAFPDSGLRIVNADDGVPGVERSLGMATSLLMVVALGIMLIGCVGAGNAVTAYLDGKRADIATLKSIGAPSRLILLLYLSQVAAASLIGIVLGLGLGGAAAFLGGRLLADWLPATPDLAAGPLAFAGLLPLLAAILFALWPLGKAASLSPHMLRRETLVPAPARPGGGVLLAMAGLTLLLVLLLVLSAPLPVAALIFAVAMAGLVLLFLAIGRGLTFVARRVKGRWLHRRPLLRLALANLHRPGAPTKALVTAIGLSLTLLVAVAALRENAGRHLAEALPASAPDLVVLNIAPEQGARFDAALAGLPQVERSERMPFLHGRVSHVDGQPVAARRIPADIAFIIRGDRGLSWRARPPAGGIVAGTWWPEDYRGPPLLSLDQKVARRLGVGIGDTLTLNLLGAPVEARIANLRKVDWARLDLDFPILLSPPPEPPPHAEIAGLWAAPGAVDGVRAALTEMFPESPILVVGEVTEFFATIAEGAGQMLTLATAVTGGAALLVLAGATMAGRRRRQAEGRMLKVLGATRRQVLLVTLIEFAAIGIAAALVALALGNLAAWAAVRELIDFRPVLAGAAGWLAAALAIVAAAALVGGWPDRSSLRHADGAGT